MALTHLLAAFAMLSFLIVHLYLTLSTSERPLGYVKEIRITSYNVCYTKLLRVPLLALEGAFVRHSAMDQIHMAVDTGLSPGLFQVDGQGIRSPA